MRTMLLVSGAACLLALAGCAQSENVADKADPAPTAEGAKYLLAQDPGDAAEVRDARQNAEQDAEVLVVGRIGGSQNPWVDGRAAFSIVDRSLLACSDREGDNCPYPWDYCCETDKLPTSTALIKIVDEQGKVVSADARELLAVKELQTVVVRGKAQRDEAGNLTVLANGVYVKK